MAENETEIPVLLRVKPDSDGTAFGVGGFSSLFGRLFGAIQRHPWFIAATAVVAFVGRAVAAQRAQQTALNTLNQALVQKGIYSRQLSQSYQDMARAIQSNTQYSDQEVMGAQANLQSYLGDKVITESLMRSVTDFATAHQMDLGQAADMFGKAIGTNVNALARYGIALDATMSPQQRLEAVQKQVNERWGGQAEAAAGGLGAIEQMKNALSDVMEVVGRAFEPWIGMVAREITAFAQSLKSSQTAMRVLDSVEIVLQVVSNGLRDALFGVVEKVPRIIGYGMKAVTAGLRGRFQEAFDMFLQAGKDGIEAAKATTREAIAEVNARKVDKQAAEDAMRLESQRQKQLTAGKKNELDTRRKKEVNLTDGELRLYNVLHKLGVMSDKEQLQTTKKGLEYLQELRNSKFGPQVAIGKAAAITMIAINTAIAIIGIWASIGWIPLFGWIAAALLSAAMVIYAGEQIANIVGSGIDNPGRIRDGTRPQEMADGGVVTHGGSLGPIVTALRDAGLNFRPEVSVTILGGLIPSRQEARRIAGLISDNLR